MNARLVKSMTMGGHSAKWCRGQFAYIPGAMHWGIEYDEHDMRGNLVGRVTVHFKRKKDAVLAMKAIADNNWNGCGDLELLVLQTMSPDDWKGMA